MSVFTRLGHTFKDFGENTSAHGIPRACVSRGVKRVLWSLVLICCIVAFAFQAKEIIERFFRYDVIVGVEVKFERILFPAVTVCNLNPYKYSLIQKIPTLNETLQSYNTAIQEYAITTASEENLRRRKRHADPGYVLTVSVKCHSFNDSILNSPTKDSMCYCLTDGYLLWKCRPASKWQETYCSKCDPNTNICNVSSDLRRFPCRCYKEFCVANDYYLVRAKWPLHIEYSHCFCDNIRCRQSGESEATNACICLSDFSGALYCDLIDHWECTFCSYCAINGVCKRSSHFNHESNCICRSGSFTECYAVENTYESDLHKNHLIRIKRESKHITEKVLSRYEAIFAVYSACICESDKRECKALPEATNGTMCTCYYDKKSGQIWYCYPPHKWVEKRCTCNAYGECNESNKTNLLPCICVPELTRKYPCLKLPDVETSDEKTDLKNGTDRFANRLIKVWNIATTTKPPDSNEDFIDDDDIYSAKAGSDLSMKVKAAEKIKHAVNNLTEAEKEALSYKKEEFLTKCSFNGRACSIEKDFLLYVDPTFGNCFTFNFNASKNMTSEKAGSAYVNVSEYLPTTESAGIRLTVHDQHEQAFPDTHGHSAPTGSVSSFGIRLKRIMRLSHPYGDCADDAIAKTEDYIYKDKTYTTEGCHRSCVQKYLANKCKCGDPRFPPYRDVPNCPFDDGKKKKCLREGTTYAAFNVNKLECFCPQPCKQHVYSVSYSASRWPAGPRSMPDCILSPSPDECLNYYREHGALIEVFFEQLNYESLIEGEAYGFSNLLSDFGGQFGLWMGVSVITLIEFGILVVEVVMKISCFAPSANRKKKREFSLESGKNSINKSEVSLTSDQRETRNGTT